MESQPPPSNRRAYTRYEIWFPVTLTLGERQAVGICRDASTKGLLVSCTASLEIGDVVTARFRVSVDSPEHNLAGRVVRRDENADELQLAFPFRLAVEFDHAQSDLEERIRRSSQPP